MNYESLVFKGFLFFKPVRADTVYRQANDNIFLRCVAPTPVYRALLKDELTKNQADDAVTVLRTLEKCLDWLFYQQCQP
jgi:hypothetical protein